MKTSIWVENGLTQLVLTPENEWEKSVINAVEEAGDKVSIMRGGFYECRGGWTRQSTTNDSLILVIDFRTEDDHGLETIPSIAEPILPKIVP
jgi:hypothetical protein